MMRCCAKQHTFPLYQTIKPPISPMSSFVHTARHHVALTLWQKQPSSAAMPVTASCFHRSAMMRMRRGTRSDWVFFCSKKEWPGVLYANLKIALNLRPQSHALYYWKGAVPVQSSFISKSKIELCSSHTAAA